MKRRKTTILCVDDHWNGLIGRKHLLEDNGYAVIEATGGTEGLKLFRSYPIDAVVLDYQMPGMSGDLIADKMKTLKPQVPILLLSAYGPLPKNKLRSVDRFLSKSQPAETLLISLHAMLQRRQKPFFHRWLDSWKANNLTSH